MNYAVVFGGRELAEEFLLEAVRVPLRVRGVVEQQGHLLKALIQDRASGLPGPRVITGRYRSSMSVITSSSNSVFEADVGTDEPYGQRLEFGFQGRDARGRFTSSNAHPHFRPAIKEIEPHFIGAIERAIMGRW